MNVVREFVKVKFKTRKNGSRFVESDGLKSETSSDMYRKRNRKLQNTVIATACQQFKLGRYVEKTSLFHITMLWQCLRWAVTVRHALPPCWQAWFKKLEHCWKSKIANLKEKSVSQKLRSSSFSTERVRKIRHRVTRCLHTHAPPKGASTCDLEKQTPSTEQKSTVQTET